MPTELPELVLEPLNEQHRGVSFEVTHADRPQCCGWPVDFVLFFIEPHYKCSLGRGKEFKEGVNGWLNEIIKQHTLLVRTHRYRVRS